MNCSVRIFSMTWDILIVGVLAIGTLLAEGMGFMEVTIIVTFCFGVFQEALKGCKKMGALILTCTSKCVLAGVVAYQTYATECESCPEDKAKILVGSFLSASVVSRPRAIRAQHTTLITPISVRSSVDVPSSPL